VPDPNALAKREKARRDHESRQRRAADKAAFILNNATKEQHPYLIRKGFPDKGLIWNSLLVLPMRVGQRLVGCQLIQEDGTKRFLSGQQTKGASLVIDNKGRNILCEGFATGMSVRRAMKHLRERYTIHVCFSAGNMLEIAKNLRDPLVIADNDSMGIATAKKIASVYWLGEAGEDFNDTEQRIGTQLAAESLRGFL
jgi:putative DNA primase/helicase